MSFAPSDRAVLGRDLDEARLGLRRVDADVAIANLRQGPAPNRGRVVGRAQTSPADVIFVSDDDERLDGGDARGRPDAISSTHADIVHLSMADESPARITRVVLKNYKSIVSCDVELRPLTILVGPNGSGKSNFLDALRFVSEALTVGLEQAIRNRGNIERILSTARLPGEETLAIEIHFDHPVGGSGSYGFEIEATPDGASRVLREWAVPDLFLIDYYYERMRTRQVLLDDPSRMQDRLYLAGHALKTEERLAYDVLTSLAFYNPVPDLMRNLKPRDAAARLGADGANVASMVRRMQAADPELIWRISQYLRRVLPGLASITAENLAGRDLLRFSVESGDEAKPFTFDADQMSDGTLRALAILVALFQHRLGGHSWTSLVGIEEPENNLHPAAGGALLNALIDASYDSQVLVTTHSTSLLDGDDVDVSSLLAVMSEDGRTRIGPIDKVSQSVLQDHLFTAGEMLQMDQLRPESKSNGELHESPTSTPSPVSQ
jgi:predicted ATPase